MTCVARRRTPLSGSCFICCAQADPQTRPAAHKPSGLTASLAELMPKPQQDLDALSELSEDDTQTPEEVRGGRGGGLCW